MRLEVISRLPEGPQRSVPLLFIHGAFASARQWERFFLPYFAGQGYAAYALSLRGHGRSAGRERLSVTRLREYVVDVGEVAQQLDIPPVIVGHSMGGMVAQHLLHHTTLSGAILLASGPPYGMVPGAMRMAFTNPLLWWDMSLMQNFGPRVSSLRSMRRALFRKDTPDDYVIRVLPEAQAESQLAALDMMGFDLPPSEPRRDVPVLVLGAEKDPFVSTVALEMTARAYGTKAVVFPRMAHAMMLDQEWESVARCMLNWLEEVSPAPQGAAAASPAA